MYTMASTMTIAAAVSSFLISVVSAGAPGTCCNRVPSIILFLKREISQVVTGRCVLPWLRPGVTDDPPPRVAPIALVALVAAFVEHAEFAGAHVERLACLALAGSVLPRSDDRAVARNRAAADSGGVISQRASPHSPYDDAPFRLLRNSGDA